jgi:hypothetical protein
LVQTAFVSAAVTGTVMCDQPTFFENERFGRREIICLGRFWQEAAVRPIAHPALKFQNQQLFATCLGFIGLPRCDHVAVCAL